MTNKQISQEVLKIIEDKKLKPKAKIYFLLKEYGIWIFAGISVLLGSLATAVIIFISKNSDWFLYHQMQQSLFKFVLLNLPYFWLFMILVFIFLFYKNFKHTKKGYKFKFEKIIAITILVSVILGIFFYNIGLGKAIENVFTKRIPFYNKYLNPRMRMWHNPRHGMLGGRVHFDRLKQEYKLKDLNNKEWKILKKKQEYLKGLKEGEYVKMFGREIEDGKFEPREIYPWQKKCLRCGK